MNFATAFVSNSSVHASKALEASSHKSNSFAPLFKDISTRNLVQEETPEQLKQLMNKLKELLENEGVKKINPDNIRNILPITYMQHSINHNGALKNLDTTTFDTFIEEHSHILNQLETFLSMLNQGKMTEDLVTILDKLEQLLSTHMDEKITFTQEELSYILEQIEAATALVEGERLKVLQEMESYFQELSVHHALSDALDQLKEEQVTKEDVMNIAQSLAQILSSIPREMQISDGFMHKVSSIIHQLEQQYNGKQAVNSREGMPLPSEFKSGGLINQQANDSSQSSIPLKALQETSEQAHALIKEALNRDKSVHIHKQLTHLLGQAQHLKQNLASLHLEESKTRKSQVEKLWSNLQTMYEKRTAINRSGVYTENAKVRSTDVGSWLQYMTRELHMSQPPMVMQQHMTPVEQYIMHVRTNDGGAMQNDQLMQQFQQIISQSALGKNQFFKQLSITIQPEQLGEMNIRLTQIDGEMIAKITVTSQTTKSALESNLHQLKNMFAPHQVLIEKQEGDSHANFEAESNKEEPHATHQDDGEDSRENDKEQGSFQEEFEQILEETVGED